MCCRHERTEQVREDFIFRIIFQLSNIYDDDFSFTRLLCLASAHGLCLFVYKAGKSPTD